MGSYYIVAFVHQSFPSLSTTPSNSRFMISAVKLAIRASVGLAAFFFLL